MRGLVAVESATLVLVAFVLSAPVAVATSRLLTSSFAASFGFDLAQVLPVGLVAVVAVIAVIALVVAVAAAWTPDRRAARLEVVEALAFE